MEKIFYEYPNPVDNKKTGIEIRTQNELNTQEYFLLKQAGLDDLAPVEAWTAIGTNIQLNYATHGIFRYYGKFPPTIGTHLIMQYTNEKDMVMDPMSGSGTTILESLLSNRNCNAFDVSPLSVLLASVKITHIEKNILIDTLESICKEYCPLSIYKFDWKPVGLKNVDHWFLPETQDSLRGLIYLINNIKEKKIKDFFTICFAATIRPVSRATTQQGRLFLDAATAKKDALDTFKNRAKKSIDAVNDLPDKHTQLDISIHDASTPFDCRAINDLVIVHPPYFNSYKYSSVNSLELAWMGVNHADVRSAEIREFFKVGKAEKISYYIEDMNKTLSNIARTLKPGGVMGLMIGDTIIKGEYLNTTKQLIDKFLKTNSEISIEKVVIRVPKYTEASWATSQRRNSSSVGINLYDFIIIFRRENNVL